VQGIIFKRAGKAKSYGGDMIFNRALTDQECKVLFKTAIPKNFTKFDWKASADNPNGVAQQTPRFRGAASVGDLNATGTISTGQGSNLALNNNDFVIFRG